MGLGGGEQRGGGGGGKRGQQLVQHQLARHAHRVPGMHFSLFFLVAVVYLYILTYFAVGSSPRVAVFHAQVFVMVLLWSFLTIHAVYCIFQVCRFHEADGTFMYNHSLNYTVLLPFIAMETLCYMVSLIRGWSLNLIYLYFIYIYSIMYVIICTGAHRSFSSSAR